MLLYTFDIATLPCVLCFVYREPKDLWYECVFLLLSDILIHDLFTKLPKQGVILFWMLARKKHINMAADHAKAFSVKNVKPKFLSNFCQKI